MTKPIRVMLCEDSAVMRRLIRTALSSDARLQVVYEARHGQDALDNLFDAHPDIVVMDIEMPVMDGVDAVRAIRQRSRRLPVIMFSALTTRGAEATLDAMAAGASDFAAKPIAVGHVDAAMQHVRRELIPKILQWAGDGMPGTAVGVAPGAKDACPGRGAMTPTADNGQRPAPRIREAIGVAVSTGGPTALAQLLSALPDQFSVPILIAQHMPSAFTRLLAERLTSHAGRQVREAVHGEPLQERDVLLAPGDHHLVVCREGNRVVTQLNQGPRENCCRPAADPLLRSLAECYGPRALGVVMTGMGRDGLLGARAIKDGGGAVFAQDEASSAVWGMPRQVVEAGLADRVVSLSAMATELARFVQKRRPASDPQGQHEVSAQPPVGV